LFQITEVIDKLWKPFLLYWVYGENDRLFVSTFTKQAGAIALMIYFGLTDLKIWRGDLRGLIGVAAGILLFLNYFHLEVIKSFLFCMISSFSWYA
jgi:hypothetical protein